MTYEPYRNTLAFHGPRFVQFWSLESDNHLGEVEVSPRNRISRTETRELIDAEVTHVAFDRDASWMGTVDVRDDREFPMDIYLKFWTYDPTSKSWTLSTRVDFPHGESKVSSLAFNPARRSSMALTTGEDRQFRVWTRREAEGTQYWACAATGEYKGRSCRSACFSADGSLFALTHDGQISLWDSQTLSLGTTLANPSAVGEPLVGAAFLGSGSRYLVGWTADKAHVWDLLTCVLTRTFVLACDGVVADRTADRFACFGRRPTTEGKDTAFVAVYDVTSSEPVMDYPVHGGVRAVEFVAGSKGLLRLAVLDRSGSVHSVMEKESTPAEQDGTKQGAEKASLEARGPGLFSSLAGRVVGGTAAADGPDGALAAQMAARATGADVLDVPSYLLPNLASVFDSFLAGLVSVRPIADPVMPASGPVPKATAAAKQSEAGNADVEMTDSASAAEDDYSFLVDLFRKSTSITAETPAKGGRKRKA